MKEKKNLIVQVSPNILNKFKAWCALNDKSMREGFIEYVENLEVQYNDSETTN